MTSERYYKMMAQNEVEHNTFHFRSLYCINHDVLHVFFVFHVMVVVSAVYDCNEHYRLDISLHLGSQ